MNNVTTYIFIIFGFGLGCNNIPDISRKRSDQIFIDDSKFIINQIHLNTTVAKRDIDLPHQLNKHLDRHIDYVDSLLVYGIILKMDESVLNNNMRTQNRYENLRLNLIKYIYSNPNYPFLTPLYNEYGEYYKRIFIENDLVELMKFKRVILEDYKYRYAKDFKKVNWLKKRNSKGVS